MQHNGLPDLDPAGNNLVLQIYGIVLWVVTVTLGLVNTTIQYHDSWVDIILEVLNRIAPLISTFFLYIINKKEIHKFFKTLRRKKD